MSRRARTHTSLLSLALLFLGIPVWIAARHTTGNTGTSRSSVTNGVPAKAVPSLPTPSNGSNGSSFVVPVGFPVALIRAGLDPSSLTAAGVTSNGVVGLLQPAADLMNGNPTALPNADTAFAAARVANDALVRKIQSGLASQDEVSSYPAVSGTLASATTTRQAALDAIFNAAAANLDSGAKNLLTQVRSNRSQDWSRDYPYEFLVITRQESEWVTLRDCLANERIAVQLPDLLSQDDQALLTTWRADPAVSAAKAALDQNLAAVTAAWNTATGQQQAR
jgi:hypothetical protein